MNIIPLYEYVSRQLNSNISLYDSQSRALAKRIVCNDAAPDFPELYPDIKSRLLGHVSVDYPMFTFLNDYICYAHFAFDNTVLITGPFHIQFSGSLMYSQ